MLPGEIGVEGVDVGGAEDGAGQFDVVGVEPDGGQGPAGVSLGRARVEGYLVGAAVEAVGRGGSVVRGRARALR